MPSATESTGHRGRDPDLGVPDTGDSSLGQQRAESQLSDDDMFEVLSNYRRRQVLEYLRDGDGTATVSDLAEAIAATENDTPIHQLSSYDRKRVYISLYQNHLPMMDDANVINYEEGRKRVQLLETVTKLKPYLEPPTEPVDRRVPIAGALAVAMIVLLGSLQIGMLSALPRATWAILGGVGLVGMGSLHLYNATIR